MIGVNGWLRALFWVAEFSLCLYRAKGQRRALGLEGGPYIYKTEIES